MNEITFTQVNDYSRKARTSDGYVIEINAMLGGLHRVDVNGHGYWNRRKDVSEDRIPQVAGELLTAARHAERDRSERR